MKIEILGPGCARRHATEKNVQLALKALNVEAEVAIDGVTKVSGKIPAVVEVNGGWLRRNETGMERPDF